MKHSNRKRKAWRLTPLSRWREGFQQVLRFGRWLLLLGLAGAVSGAVYLLLDRPIREIEINGTWQRITKAELAGMLRDQDVVKGFLSTDLEVLQRLLQQQAWIDRVRVQRRWPNGLHLFVVEQTPAARWGEDGLLNARGELFVRGVRQIPKELPQLNGPEKSEWRVAQYYFDLSQALQSAGLSIRELSLDERGAWFAVLSNGSKVNFGKEELDKRMHRLMTVIAPRLMSGNHDIDYVDLRYSNGFAVRNRGDRADQGDQGNQQSQHNLNEREHVEA